MPSGKLHVDELETSVDLVRRLLAAQHPHWSDLPIEHFDSTGTSNSLYRLGDDMVVRLPRRPGSAPAVGREHRWLPELAPHLPLPIPVPLAFGAPGDGFPSVWSVYTWLDGESAAVEEITDPRQAATDLGRFVLAMQQIDPTDGPRPDDGNYGRGCPLAARDGVTRRTIAGLDDLVDTAAAQDAWEDALAAPAWSEPGVWIHGDLMPGNLLFAQGQLNAVIDFGCFAVGDPACDLQIAWNLFTDDARDAYRAALPVDDATWARGRGWALSIALLQLQYYQHSNRVMADIARVAIDAVLADHVA